MYICTLNTKVSLHVNIINITRSFCHGTLFCLGFPSCSHFLNHVILQFLNRDTGVPRKKPILWASYPTDIRIIASGQLWVLYEPLPDMGRNVKTVWQQPLLGLKDELHGLHKHNLWWRSWYELSHMFFQKQVEWYIHVDAPRYVSCRLSSYEAG